MNSNSTRSWLDRSPLRFNELALLLAIGVVILFTLIVDRNHSYFHFPVASFKLIAINTSLLGIFALGAMVVIISGGIDLSAGSMIAFSATVCACIMLALAPEAMEDSERDVPGWIIALAVSASLLSGLCVGTLHAWLVTAIRLPPFIATLASLVGLRSFARALIAYTTASVRGSSGGGNIDVNEPFFKTICAVEYVWIPLTIFAALAATTWIILSMTVLGRHVYALGGNEQAARLSGIRTENVKWFAYCFAAFTSSVAGVLYVANEGVAAPVNQALGHELNGIAAAVVGGCSLQGGIGTVQGLVLGALFLRVVIDAVAKIIKTGADVYEGLIVGIVVVIAVTFSQLGQIIASGNKMFAGALGICVIPVLAIVAGSIVLMTAGDWGRAGGAATTIVTLALLGGLKAYESLRRA